MDSTVRDLLSGYTPRPGAIHVFPSASGGRLDTVQKAFRNARTRAAMPDLHFHDLRHTFASHWVMNGGDLYILKDILGHKSIAMTQRYAHLSPAYKRTMVDRMEKMWEKSVKMANAEDRAIVASECVPGHIRVTSDTDLNIANLQDLQGTLV
jgi:integrase